MNTPNYNLEAGRGYTRLMNRLFVKLIGLCWCTLLIASAAHGQTDVAIQPPQSLLPPEQSTATSAEDQAQCFQAALNQTGDTVWCDLLITRLNQQLPLDAVTETTLTRVYHNRAVLLINSGELALADADLMAALKLGADIPELHLTLGNLRLTQNRFAEALDHYNEAIVLSDGRTPEYFTSRALALRGLGQIELAAADARRARGEQGEQGERTETQSELSPSDTDVPPAAGFQ